MTDKQHIPETLTHLADREFETSKTWLAQLEGPERTAFLIEICRVLDLHHVLQHFSRNPDNKLKLQDFDVMVRGWNPALALLLPRPSGFVGVPLMESTGETLGAAMTLLHQLGRSVLLRESAEMVRYGMATGRLDGDRIVLRMSDRVAVDHFLDRLEEDRLKKLESTEGWSDPVKAQASKSLLKDVDSVLEALVFPWESTRGVMIGYGAEPSVDKHFLALVAENTIDWRNEAGIHPDAKFGNVNGGLLAAIGLLLISFYLKHIRFVEVGKRKIPESNYAMSLTIWKPESELANSLSEFTGIPKTDISAALDCFVVRPDDSSYFSKETTPFIPMLIEISDGYVLSPISSIFRNPFEGIRKLQERSFTDVATTIREPREAWMRSELCHLFLGTRYEIVDRPSLLKRGGNPATDIDAAVLDRTTGELGLFQLKWQDFGTNELRKQRSKAKNFVDQVDDWAKKTEAWIADFGWDRLSKSLGLVSGRHVQLSAIKLFAIGRLASRFQSYGYCPKSGRIAVCKWAQFVRLRYEVGPVEHVLGTLHSRIRAEQSYPVELKPLPYEISVAGQRVEFEDLWNVLPDEGDETTAN